MATSYTTRIRLAKQGDGDNPNSWGTVLNDGVISLVDDAIAAYTTVSIGSAATVTLSAVDGASDVPRSAFLHVKGSVGGSHTTISLIIPEQSKSYVINNQVSANTTASDIVKIKTASGAATGYDVPFGAVGLVISDGASVWSTNAKGLGFGTAASADIGVCATNLPKVSAADLRYVRTSVTTDATIRGNITYEAGALKVGTSARTYSPFVTVTDAACVSVNFALGNNFVVTLGGNRTLKAPANCTAGQGGTIHVIQDSTGSRTLGYNTAWQFVSGTAPTLSTGGSDVDILCYLARSSTTIDAALLKNFDR
jgi:hypothetical protein